MAKMYFTIKFPRQLYLEFSRLYLLLTVDVDYNITVQLNCFANGSVCRLQSDYHITNSIAHHGAFHGEDKVREFLCTLSKTIKILPHYSYVPVLTGMQQERTKETSKAAREGRCNGPCVTCVTPCINSLI